MKHAADDTIAAIATPLGVGGVGVVRVSGERAKEILACLFVCSNGSMIDSHRMVHGWLIDPKTDLKVDEVLACLMRSPKSYTGENVVEFYCHGGLPVVQRVLALALDSGARLAQKGEFTRRAFLNGKLDLAQAEAVLDLVNAQTVHGAGFAVRQLEGRLSNIVKGTRSGLVDMLAELEALIDFPDDLPELNYDQFVKRLGGSIQEIDKLLATADSGRIYRVGLPTVIIGKPNVGKSSLLNTLLGEERAIVAELPGTTRDAIEETVNVQGMPLRIIDTAGIRHPKDRAEELGVERARKELDAADFTLVVIDASAELDSLDKAVLGRASGKQMVLVLNKIDLGVRINQNELGRLANGSPTFKVSALTGEGIEELKEGVFKYIQSHLFQPFGEAVVINTRHKECLARAKEALVRASKSGSQSMPVDFISIDLKGAVVALGEVAGEMVSEEVINTIFERFCVGK
ncbi:MAG: tRNA uridine-5-carboxymethylaminomethyl(34) synthesis GTPase MnmE [Candidatus Margulisiibacteriota bacterium]